MPKYRSELFFVTILISIDKILRNTEDLDFDGFVSDEKIFSLAIRELLICAW